MDGDAGDFGWFQGRRFLASGLRPFPMDRQPFPPVERFISIQNLSKNGVHVVQVRLFFVQNEELRFVGVWTSVRHRQSSSSVVFVVGMELVGKGYLVAPDRRFLSGDVGRVTSLNHKAANVSMEYRAVVFSRGRQCEKVKGGPWARIAKDLAFQIPVCRVDCDGH